MAQAICVNENVFLSCLMSTCKSARLVFCRQAQIRHSVMEKQFFLICF